MKISLKDQATISPALPMCRVPTYSGSALPLEFTDIPGVIGSATVAAVAVSVTNADGAAASAPCVPVCGEWRVTFAANLFQHYGFVERGVSVELTLREGELERNMTLAVGDLEVMRASPSATPGDPTKSYQGKGDDIYVKTSVVGDVQHYAKQTISYDEEMHAWGAEWTGDYILEDGEFIPYEAPTGGGIATAAIALALLLAPFYASAITATKEYVDRKDGEIAVAMTNLVESVSNAVANLDEAVVHKDGQETVGGYKKFRKAVTVGTRATDSLVGDGSFGQGTDVVASGASSFAGGYKSEATNDFAYALGRKARAQHRSSFVWQGSKGVNVPGYYESHDDGTFNVKPVGLANGFYIGEKTLPQIIEDLAPAPGDYATVSNAAIFASNRVETAVQTNDLRSLETDPNVPAWAKQDLSTMYSQNLYSLLYQDFYANDEAIKSQHPIWVKGNASTAVTVGRGSSTDNSYPYARQNRLGFSAYEDLDHYAHYRPRGIIVWPWWDEDAEDSVEYLFPTNGNGGTFALTSDIPGETSNVVTKAYVEGLGISSDETDPTIGLTNGTIYVKGSTITPLTSHQSLSGYVPTSRTVNSKPLSSNVNLDASDVGAYSSADGTSLANIVNSWEGYWDGTNVIFEVTNYYGNTSGEIPRLRIRELREGAWQTVWDEANKFQVCETNIMSNVVAYVTGEVDGVKDYASGNFAPIAWGTVTDKGSTNVVGNSVWMTAPETYFAGGTEYQRVAVGSGMICVLTDNGALAKTTGEPGTFRFQDEGGTNYFGFAKSDSYTIGCNTDGIVVEGTLVTLRYDVIMGGGDVPIVYWRQSLTSGEWVQLNNADGTATQGAPYTVTWYTSGGSYYAAINCGANASGFFKAETSVAGDVVFETNMKMRIDGGLSCTNTATGVMGVIRPTYNGSSVSWTWSAK